MLVIVVAQRLITAPCMEVGSVVAILQSNLDAQKIDDGQSCDASTSVARVLSQSTRKAKRMRSHQRRQAPGRVQEAAETMRSQ